MTLFTNKKCTLCNQLKKKFDLAAMQVHVEILDMDNAEALAHLAWHGLVETARKTLPILVLDDSSMVDDFPGIENHLVARAMQHGVACRGGKNQQTSCESGICTLH